MRSALGTSAADLWEWLPAAVFLAVPAAGVALYLRQLTIMRRERTPNPPRGTLFLVFATYGALVLLLLHVPFNLWSGGASLGFAALLFIAPVVMGTVALVTASERNVSAHHRRVFWGALAYVAVSLCCLAALAFFARQVS